MLHKLTLNDFDFVYKIMEDSFPLTEFRPKNEQLALFNDKRYQIYGIRKENQVVSFAAIWNFDDFIFVEHLATAKDYRNCGLGASLLNEIIISTSKTVCLEVEPPVDDLTKRRIVFYERCGMNFNSYPYIQPSISEGRMPIPLFIMTSKDKIDKHSFEKIKDLLYKNVYKVK